MAAQTQAIMPSSLNGFVGKPPTLPMDTFQRAVSDLSLELKKENLTSAKHLPLPPLSEVEKATCECCGMSEDFTQEYIRSVREKFCGKWACGLCSVAIDEEVARLGKDAMEEAINSHMAVCVRFNRVGRINPTVFLADGMRQILKKSSRARSSTGPRDMVVGRPGIVRSSSCIPAITKEAARIHVSN